jgi:hypothetical protein
VPLRDAQLTPEQKQRFGDLRVRNAASALYFMNWMYGVLIAYSIVVVAYCVVLIVMFVVKAAGGFTSVSWDVLGKYFFGTAGLGVGTWFFKPVRDHLLKQSI